MQRTIIIAKDEQRCRPFSRECALKTTCARSLASRGSTDEPDLSGNIQRYMGVTTCARYLSVDAAAAGTKPQVKPWPKVEP